MSLTITINRTEDGLFRAELTEHVRSVFEHTDLSGLVEELKRKLDLIAVTPDGRILLAEIKICGDSDEATARAEVERVALRNEELDELIDRHPVPAAMGRRAGMDGCHLSTARLFWSRYPTDTATQRPTPL